MKTLETVANARLAAAEAKRKILEPKNNIFPGPWTAAGDFVFSANGSVVCRAADYPNTYALVRTIATVPELVAALRTMLSAHDIRDPEEHRRAMDTAANIAREALAKTGQDLTTP